MDENCKICFGPNLDGSGSKFSRRYGSGSRSRSFKKYGMDLVLVGPDLDPTHAHPYIRFFLHNFLTYSFFTCTFYNFTLFTFTFFLLFFLTVLLLDFFSVLLVSIIYQYLYLDNYLE